MAEEQKSGRLGRLVGRGGGRGQATIDPITELPNREDLPAWIEHAVARGRRFSASAVLCLIDVGLLREVNDAYGQDTGDEVLAQVADRLRAIDVPGTRIARYGGATFAVMFERVVQFEHAEEIARFLVEHLSKPYDVDQTRISVTVTVGAALTAETHHSPDMVIRDAQIALSQAHEQGPGSWKIIDDLRSGRFAIQVDEASVRNAIENDEFSVYYQPIVDLADHHIVGVEALLRWEHGGVTSTGVLQPVDFLPLLERTGLSVPVGERLMERACSQVAQWNSIQADDWFLCCNVGARQLASRSLSEAVLGAASRAGLSPELVSLDITEGALRLNHMVAWGALREITNAGVRLGLGDFGVGESGIIWLRELPINMIRIDRYYVEGLRTGMKAGMGMNQVDATIIRNVAALARDLEMTSVGEGIESAAEAEAIASLGVDLGQGFHFGRPAPAGQLTERVVPDPSGIPFER